MLNRNLIRALALTALTFATFGGSAQSQDASRYPDWKGAWERFIVPGLGGQPTFDQTKPWGRGQQAPLTPEYQAIFEASLADQAQGGQGNFFEHSARCMPGGMPLLTLAFNPQEFIITPETTYILIAEHNHYYRRIFTDGRDWPKDLEPTYAGYSIGRWIDERGEGRYDALEVETRGFKGPRAYDASGLPLHYDNASIFKERIYRDRSNPNIMHDEVTVIDDALTRPWTVDKRYVLEQTPRTNWAEPICAEASMLIGIGKEMYSVSGDGLLMPVRRDQPPPDLRYFNQNRK
jgi:hypothetical protein